MIFVLPFSKKCERNEILLYEESEARDASGAVNREAAWPMIL